jgi:peptide/nickel transport system permease protein
VLSFLIRRLAASLALVAIVLTLLFALLETLPDDATLSPPDPAIDRQQRETLRRLQGRDRPASERYLAWLGDVVHRFDWGDSLVYQRPVQEVLAARLPNTLLLALAALTTQFAFGLGAGAIAARRAHSWQDNSLRAAALALYSVPTFWLGLMGLLLFSHHWRLFPPGHLQSWNHATLSDAAALLDLLHHLALPALVLGAGSAARVLRFARGGLLATSQEPFLVAARARGLSRFRIRWLHALRPAAAPLVQILGLSLPFLLSGALVVEVVFSLPGMGRLAYDSLLARDYPVVMAASALSATLVVAGSLLADLLQALLEPRVRDG